MRKATTAELARRLAVCQIAGTILGVLIGGAASEALHPHAARGSGSWDAALPIGSVLLIGIPFYVLALALLRAFRRPVLRSPIAWCAGVPAALLLDSLAVFPPPLWRGAFWIVLIPLCALLSGALFLLWLRRSPLAA